MQMSWVSLKVCHFSFRNNKANTTNTLLGDGAKRESDGDIEDFILLLMKL
jgi:hypothetical protein